jgi:PAS domain S-box-containing protein
MFKPTAEPDQHLKLRADAEARLKAGSAPPTKGWPTGVSALSLLHQLASTPASASDALKLLHELQVHQVELDLQHEQMETSVRELAEALAQYKGLFEFAPAGYFRIGHQGEIIEGNLSGAALFGVKQGELNGRHIDSFLAPDSRLVFLEMLQRLRDNSSSRDGCEVQTGRDGNISRRIHIVASVTPGGKAFLMVLSECDRPQTP